MNWELPLSEMTDEELDREIAELKEICKARASSNAQINSLNDSEAPQLPDQIQRGTFTRTELADQILRTVTVQDEMIRTMQEKAKTIDLIHQRQIAKGLSLASVCELLNKPLDEIEQLADELK